ncbi:uncharacterized protein FMAN_15511 [Fusarium mangiferae]|uniref:Uncharacterized protein n=1 Tax=Fusarium mangiferae TaxID=192010 RepID=A0A1L7ULK9_FUSMA|nr:uncharacterized protein FMAN_15511 [Fusarium mangiferae]CVL09353.1 uncharacterized protein FMAN_15511 [Fusarium mangiferae]
MDTLIALNQVDSQTLTPNDRRLASEILRDFARRVQASDILAPALVVQEPDFKRFEWPVTNRLELLINALDAPIEPDDGRFHTLCEQDPLVVIICGLCLTKKKILRINQDLWDEVLRQAQTASQRLGPQFLHHTQINEIVAGTSGNFKQRFDQTKRYAGSISHMTMRGVPSYFYPMSDALKFRNLISLAFNRTVTAYLPAIEFKDACIRLTVLFDQEFLARLTGVVIENYDAEGCVLEALKEKIAPILGDDVLQACQKTQMWAQESKDKLTTQCVTCNVVPGQVIVLDVFVDWQEGIAFVNKT